MKNPIRRKTAAAAAREWVVITADGSSRLEEIAKQGLVQRTGLSTRDLRVVDPVLSYPSSILGRDRAVIVNLVHIRAVVTAFEVFLSNPRDPLVEPVRRELESRLAGGTQRVHSPDNAQRGQEPMNDVPRHGSAKTLPFEFRALELCLELASKRLEIETLALEKEAYPALDELTHNVSTLNLERVRQIKSRLVSICSRAKMRDELEHLLDDDVDMAFLHLSEKLIYQASVSQSSRFDFYKQPPQSDNESDGEDDEEDAAEPEIEEIPDENQNETAIGFRPDLDELEMLLEAYFVQSEGILNKLTTLRDYVDDTEDYINIMLDDKQNQLLQMRVMLSTATMILSIGITVVGVLGMNIRIDLFKVPPSATFWQTVGGVAVGSVGLYIIILALYKRRKLL